MYHCPFSLNVNQGIDEMLTRVEQRLSGKKKKRGHRGEGRQDQAT